VTYRSAKLDRASTSAQFLRFNCPAIACGGAARIIHAHKLTPSPHKRLARGTTPAKLIGLSTAPRRYGSRMPLFVEGGERDVAVGGRKSVVVDPVPVGINHHDQPAVYVQRLAELDWVKIKIHVELR
jgi:hypothetical protein